MMASYIPFSGTEVLERLKTNGATELLNITTEGESRNSNALPDEYCLQICRAAQLEKATEELRSRAKLAADIRRRPGDARQLRSAKGVYFKSLQPAAGGEFKTTSRDALGDEKVANGPPAETRVLQRLLSRRTVRGRESTGRLASGLQRADTRAPSGTMRSRRREHHSQLLDRKEASPQRMGTDMHGKGGRIVTLNKTPNSRTFQDTLLYEEILPAYDCVGLDDGDCKSRTLSDRWGSFTFLIIAGFVACVAFFVAVLLIAWHVTVQATSPALV